MRATWRGAWPATRVVDDLDAIPVDLRGVHPRNPVNAAATVVCSSSCLRWCARGPKWADLPPGAPTPLTQALVDGLAEAARTW